MKHHIFSRYSRTKVIYECELPDDTPSGMRTRLALEKAAGADANLTGANLTRAYLTRANLTGANLTGANLTDANLTGANLTDANLTRANLTHANLTRANLMGANLTGANLMDANLTDAKNDFLEVLLRAPHEVAGLRAALVTGKVDGSTYEGACACLVGTIANVRGAANYHELGNGLNPNSNRPAERWFLAIKKGNTPETNPISKITVQWLDEFVYLLNIAKAAS